MEALLTEGAMTVAVEAATGEVEVEEDVPVVVGEPLLASIQTSMVVSGAVILAFSMGATASPEKAFLFSRRSEGGVVLVVLVVAVVVGVVGVAGVVAVAW